MNNKDRFKVEITDMDTKAKSAYYTNSEHMYFEALPSLIDGKHSEELENVKIVLQYASKQKRKKKS